MTIGILIISFNCVCAPSIGGGITDSASSSPCCSGPGEVGLLLKYVTNLKYKYENQRQYNSMCPYSQNRGYSGVIPVCLRQCWNQWERCCFREAVCCPSPPPPLSPVQKQSRRVRQKIRLVEELRCSEVK